MLCEPFMDYGVKTKSFFRNSSELSAKHADLNNN